MATHDAEAFVDDDNADPAPTDPPKKRRRPKVVPIDQAPTAPPEPVVRGSEPPKLVISTDDDHDDDDLDEQSPAPKRARRRPRVEHVSQPPRTADDVETSPEQPAKKATRKKQKKPVDRIAHLPLEIAGVVIIAISILSVLALLSYSSKDTAAGRVGPVDNWIGIGGAIFADLLTLIFGVGAFLVPFGLAVSAVACFRPVKQPRHALLRTAGGIGAALAVLALLHLVMRGSHALPFPAGGLLGALIADGASRFIAPLGTGIVAVAVAFVGSILALDRPLGPTTHSIGEKLVELFERARERLDVWREERRLLIEEEERLRQELDEERARAEKSNEPEEQKVARKKKIFDEAEKRAKKRLQEAQEKRISVAPVGPSNPPVEAPKDTVVSPTADPAWALEEPDVDGKVLSLNAVLGREPVVTAPPEDGAERENDDGSFRIVERAHVDPKAVEQATAPVVEQPRQAFHLPPLNLLDYDAPQAEPIDEAKMRLHADKLVAKFRDFGIEGRVREVRPGPVCTTYEFVPAPGIKVSKIAALADDIAMAMEAIHVRIVAPIPGKGAVGIEIPNDKRETVYMKEIIADPAFGKRAEKLMMALGKDIEGRPYYANLSEMPHVLIAGTTGSGKSVSVNAMICSILYRATPDDVRFLMIDPKMLELSLYEGIPHLLLPPIIDSKKAACALKWAVNEMERRYQLMSELGVRDIAGFNVRVQDALDGKDDDAKKTLTEALQGKKIEKLPFIVIVVDEYADLLAVAGKDVETYVMRLAQKARAAGLHVMLATQRPSVDVITGVIKANFPVRMGFRLASSHDSKTIINRPGAEKLLGRGDMLFMPPGTSNVSRVHGAFISEKELHRVVDFLKQQGNPNYDMSILQTPTDDSESDGGELIDEPKDARYDEAVQVVARTRKCSTSWLQRMMNLGYQRAARIVDRMEREGLVGPAQNAKGDREIFVKPEASP